MDTLPRSLDELAKSLRENNRHYSSNGAEFHGAQTKKSHNVNWKHYGIMLLLFSILIVSMIMLISIDSHKCTIDRKTVDSCIRRLIFFSSDLEHFPQTHKQLDNYCKDKSQSLKCLKQFVGGCMNLDKNQFKYFNKYALNYKHQLDKTCHNHRERQKFIQYSNCLTSRQVLKNATQCNDNFRSQMLYIVQNIKSDQKVEAACCAKHLHSECLHSKVSGGCEQEARNFFMDQIESPFRAIIQTLCKTNHQTVTGCQHSFKPDVWQKIFLHPENLMPKINNTLFYDNIYNHYNLHKHNDEEEESGENDSDDVDHREQNSSLSSSNAILNGFPMKLVQLKFYENFLSFFLIISSNNKLL